jgi:hypothetical protein
LPIYRLNDQMLREDTRTELVRLPVTLPRMFMGRWTLQSGRKVYPERWKDAKVEAWRREQQREPVRLRAEGRRSFWWFRDRFYWDDAGHSAEDVKALILKRRMREERQLNSARALMRGQENQAARRDPIPPQVARAVLERDGRRCVECGSSEELQFDHIIPVALGGATTPANLQVLCSDCNRAKSDGL